MGKGDNAGYQHFLPFTTVFPKTFLKMEKALYHFGKRLNPLPKNKILDRSNSKAFVDDKTHLSQKLEFDFGKGRKHCGKRRKCWLPAFSSFPTIFFQKASSSGWLVGCIGV